MSNFNYSWHRRRLKLPSVNKLPRRGSWKTVADAASSLGVSKMTVRRKYLLREIDAVVFGRIIYVNIDSWGKN